MKVTIRQAHFFEFTNLSNILSSPAFIYYDLLNSNLLNPPEYFIAKVQGEIIGFAQLSWNSVFERELVRLYVLPNFQRKGIGRSLLKKCCSCLEKNSRLVVKVEKHNLRAIAFYEAFGFQKIREVLTPNGDNLLEYWLYNTL